MIAIVLMYAFLASAFILAKATLMYATPYFIVAFRMLLAGSLFLGLQYVFDRKNFFLRKGDLWLFLKTSLFYIYLAFVPEFWALEKLSASKVTLLYGITPFIVAILAFFIASERFTKKKLIGMIIGFIGIIPMILRPDMAPGARELFSVSTREGALLVAIFAGAYGWFPVKKLMGKGYKLTMINGITMLLGGAGALVTSFLVEGIWVQHVSSIPHFLFWVFLLILAANGLFYHMYGWLLQRYSFTLLSFAGFLCPIFGSLFGWLFLGEEITLYHLASFILIGTGLSIFYRDELKGKLLLTR